MTREDVLERNEWVKLEQVICRQESRADERPLKFRWQGKWIQIHRVTGNWLQRGPGENDSTWRMFEVECDRGTCQLRIRTDGWVWECRGLSGD